MRRKRSCIPPSNAIVQHCPAICPITISMRLLESVVINIDMPKEENTRPKMRPVCAANVKCSRGHTVCTGALGLYAKTARSCSTCQEARCASSIAESAWQIVQSWLSRSVDGLAPFEILSVLPDVYGALPSLCYANKSGGKS